MPTHYSFKVAHRLDELRRSHDEMTTLTPEELAARREARHRRSSSRPSDKQARAIIEALDERGAWVTEGKLNYHGKSDETRRIIDSAVFCRNLEILSRYAAP